MRAALTCIILLSALLLRAEVKTVSFSDMAAYHVRAVAHLEPLPLGLGASVVTVAQGPVRFDDPVYSLAPGVHRLQFRDSDGYLDVRDAEGALEFSLAPVSATPIDWVRALYGRIGDESPFWNLSYVMTEWLIVDEDYVEPQVAAHVPRRVPAEDPPLTNDLRFTMFSVASEEMTFALEWPASVHPEGSILDLYGTRDLRSGDWSVVHTFSTDGIQAYTNTLPVSTIPGWHPNLEAPHDSSCVLSTNVVGNPLFSGECLTNIQWNCDHQPIASPPGFLWACDRGDGDGNGIPDAFEAKGHRLDSDGDGVSDLEELGAVEILPEDGFLWLDVSGTRNEITSSTGSDYVWSNIFPDRTFGGKKLNWSQMCLDGFWNLVPDVNWRQDQVNSWNETNDLFRTDFSRGGVTVMAMPGNLYADRSWNSGMYLDSVVTNGTEYAVFEWKNVGIEGVSSASGPLATFEILVPSDEPDTVYVSYFSVDDGFLSEGLRFGVQDSSRRSSVDSQNYYCVSRLGRSDFPRSRQTVKYKLGLNTHPRARDDYQDPGQLGSFNTNAYYTVMVRAEDGPAMVSFVGDGESDLVDPSFVLGKGKESQVRLLKGKTYTAFSSGPVAFSETSSSGAVITPGGADGDVSVVSSVQFSTVDERDVDGNDVSRIVVSPDLNGVLRWSGACHPSCDPDGIWRLRCQSACGCGRCEVKGTYSYEGYCLPVNLGPCRCPQEGDDSQTIISCPDTLFNNDDSDRVAGEKDSDLGSSTGPEDNPLADDDVVPMTITFGVSNGRGTARISSSGGKLRFWDSKEKRHEICLPKTISDIALPHTEQLWVEAKGISSSYEDQSVSVTWETSSGRHSGGLTKKITSVEPIVEPVCSEEKTVGDDKYIYNPSCLVNDGRSAWFKATWQPSDYPASRVTWTCENRGVRFWRGNTGDEVCVRTSASAGSMNNLSLRFGDCASVAPKLGFEIVESRTVKIYVVPVVATVGNATPHLQSGVFKRVNEIMSQCGVSFSVVECSEIEFSGVSRISARDPSSYSHLRRTAGLNDGLVVYVVSRMRGAAPAFVFELGDREMVVSSACSGEDVAHEICHSFRLNDIYCNSHENPYGKLNAIKAADGYVSQGAFKEIHDWNSGSGARYYPSELLRMHLIPRFLMYGGTESSAVDIPLDEVKGVRNGDHNAALFEDDNTKIGRGNMIIYDSLLIEE